MRPLNPIVPLHTIWAAKEKNRLKSMKSKIYINIEHRKKIEH